MDFIGGLIWAPGFDRAWIGGQRKGKKFQWIDGSPFNFSNWYAKHNDPNNMNNNENCIEVYSNKGQDSNGFDEKWNDHPCYELKNFVCKKQIVEGGMF